jgi:hypothetical protein
MLVRILSALALSCACLGAFAPVASAADPGCANTGSGTVASGWYACAGAGGTPGLPTRLETDAGEPSSATSPAVATVSNVARADSFCTYSNTDPVDGTAPPAPRAGGGRWVFVYCGDSGQPGGWSWVAGAGPVVVFPSPAQLARQAYAQLSPPVGVPDYNPRRNAGGPDGTVVGFATWLWLDGGSPAVKPRSTV